MPKYHVVAEDVIHEHYYITANSEEEAEEKIIECNPDETYHKSYDVIEIELDDSLDEPEENDLKERKWNKDVQ